jgi:hypothetical protein
MLPVDVIIHRENSGMITSPKSREMEHIHFNFKDKIPGVVYFGSIPETSKKI